MNLALQENIYQAQDLLLSMPQVDCKVYHHFSDGLYARELHIPAGVCVGGALHKTRHMFVVQSGRCTFVSHEGKQDIEGPYMGETLPGTKRIIYAHTDTIMIGFHVTDLTDVDAIGRQILEDWH